MKILRKSSLWLGLAATFVALLLITVFVTNILLHFSVDINSYLGIEVSKIVNSGDDDTDTLYYKSEFGAFTSENLKKLDEASFEQARNEAREGTVLLRNENNTLPLKSDERGATLFGNATHNPLYRTYSAGSGLCSDPEWTTDLKEALEKEKFAINNTLWDAYASDSAATGVRPQDRRGKGGNANNTEHPKAFYSKYTSSWASSYNDVAIVNIARQGGEGVDMNVSEDDDLGSPNLAAGIKISSLALHQNEKDMLEIVKNGGFDKIIVLINSPYFMELGWFSEYNVDAALWISTPGSVGFEGVAEIITGKVNPSAQLSDTWAANSLSAPAMANSNGNSPMWANIDEIHDSGIVTDGQTANGSVWDWPVVLSYVNIQQENIYVGYKYYETRYADIIMNQGGANSSAGKFASTGTNWSYADEMCYPFGFGLSYTTFTQAIESVSFNSETDNYTVKVKVTNTGDVAGKKAVIVYAQTPYGKYEKDNLVEKSAIQAVGYEKTGVLAAKAETTVNVTVDRYMLAAYDTNKAKGYILSGGEYYFGVGDSSHDALNNILAARGFTTGLVDHDGKTAKTSSTAVHKVNDGLHSNNDDPDESAYSHSAATGRRVTNLFDYGDYNYWKDDTGISVKYLSRNDWSGTFPTRAANVTIKGSRMENMLQGNTYTQSTEAPPVSSFNFDQDNDITFVMMKDVAWEDDVMWNKFIDQFTLRELAELNRGRSAIEKIALPTPRLGDACDSAGSLPGTTATLGYGDDAVANTYNPGRGTVVFPSLLGATFSKELQVRRGEIMGELWLYSKTNFACTGGGNIRRTPFSGRNAEYFTEDANINSLIGEIEMGAMQAKGVVGGPKHFATNDLEYNRMGISTFATEQALRETSLRSFEYTLRNDRGDLHYVMTSNFRIGPKWTLCNRELLSDLLRGEWGFRGVTNSDCALTNAAGFTSNFVDVLMAGHDSCYSLSNDISIDAWVNHVNENNDGHAVSRLRQIAKNSYYCWTRSSLVNGLNSTSKIVPITPTWQILLYVGIGVIAVLAAAAIAMLILSTYKFNKGREV